MRYYGRVRHINIARGQLTYTVTGNKIFISQNVNLEPWATEKRAKDYSTYYFEGFRLMILLKFLRFGVSIFMT